MPAAVPVACSNTVSLPEVACEAALLFDLLAVHEIAMIIRRLSKKWTLRTELARKVTERGQILVENDG